ncbi:MAG: 50S ribosomal protein L25 [Dehalococcoidia bacterium]|nr:MAG: 50S ribosomal protein L25 [Dehalococcoidia bacterium]
MEQIELRATNREVLGRKVRFLRRQGIIPVHLFGHNVESLALQCDAAQLQRVLAQAGKTRLINLKLDKAKRPRTVVVREIHRDMLTSELLHVDFYQVRMAEKIKVEVPIVLIGEALALKSKENMLLQELSSLTIECLPDQIPTNVDVDLSSLTEAEQAIRVKDVVLDEEIAILSDPEHVVVKISSRPKEEVVEEVVAEEVAEAPEAAPLPGEESKEE